MTASSVIEYYRQFAFVSSVLAGFAFSFYGVLLSASAQHRATNLAALLAVMASIAFLLVTLGMTFAAAIAASLPNNGKMPSSILAQQTPLSFCFLVGIALFIRGLWSWGMDSVTPIGYRHDCYRRLRSGRCYSRPHTLPSLNRRHVKHLSRRWRPQPSQREFSVLVATHRYGLSLSVRAPLLRRALAHNRSARLPAK